MDFARDSPDGDSFVLVADDDLARYSSYLLAGLIATKEKEAKTVGVK